jgi:predicted peptidase
MIGDLSLTIGKPTRRQALRICGAGFALVGCGVCEFLSAAVSDAKPPLAPGMPNSPERLARIDDFKKRSEGLQDKFEARTYKSDWTMPYRLFRPAASGKLPLVLYLSGSGGLGDDNLKQIGLGNIFGTRVWLLPENQKQFPCFVVAPQTDRGWAKYDFTQQGSGGPKTLAGLGDGSRLALEIVDSLRHEFPIDERRIYVAGQSMGGAGVWNVIAARPDFFAAGIVCCGSLSTENGTESISTPLWVFHGDDDKSVPISLSRERVAARRKAGGHPLYTEYAGVDHNCWEWAFTEPELVKWLSAQRRS